MLLRWNLGGLFNRHYKSAIEVNISVARFMVRPNQLALLIYINNAEPCMATDKSKGRLYLSGLSGRTSLVSL